MKMLKPILTTVEAAAQEGLKEIGRDVLKRARELSPTDTGKSDRSGFSQVDDLTAQVGFTSLVSRLNHEDLDARFPSGGQAKFLETAADEIDLEARMVAKLREKFGS